MPDSAIWRSDKQFGFIAASDWAGSERLAKLCDPFVGQQGGRERRGRSLWADVRLATVKGGRWGGWGARESGQRNQASWTSWPRLIEEGNPENSLQDPGPKRWNRDKNERVTGRPS